jgi:hypothetical protein
MRVAMLVAILLTSVAGLVGGCKKKAVSRVDSTDASGRTDPVPIFFPKDTDIPRVNPSARPALPAGWRQFRHPEGAYTIYAPGPLFPPKTSNNRLNQPVPQGAALRSKFVMRLPVSKPGTPYCEVEVVAFSLELVDATRAAMERNSHILGAAHPTKAAVTWAGHPAVEESGEQETSDRHRRFDVQRWMFVGNRLYGAALWGMDGHPTAEERAAFFDSFTLGQ